MPSEYAKVELDPSRERLLVHGLDVRVISESGEVLRHLRLDPARDYQPQA